MILFRAIRMLATERFTFCRRHEWRRVAIDRSMLWPRVTIGWWTWDALGPEIGPRVAEMIDTLGERE